MAQHHMLPSLGSRYDKHCKRSNADQYHITCQLKMQTVAAYSVTYLAQHHMLLSSNTAYAAIQTNSKPHVSNDSARVAVMQESQIQRRGQVHCRGSSGLHTYICLTKSIAIYPDHGSRNSIILYKKSNTCFNYSLFACSRSDPSLGGRQP